VFVHMVQGQAQAYRIDNKKFPESIETMVTDGYLRKDETKCPGGKDITIDAKGEVQVNET
jgi:competence protein ComGC